MITSVVERIEAVEKFCFSSEDFELETRVDVIAYVIYLANER